jgi:uncharacterized membrane protein (DUF4010 family)
MMYLRLAVLLGLFNRGLLAALGPYFAVLAAVAIGTGWLWSRRPDPEAHKVRREYEAKNPLDLRVAFTFAALFLAMLVVTHLALVHLGTPGVYSLAAVMGVVDVDPFILSMTQSGTPGSVAAGGVLIAAASNNVVKGIYACALSDRRTGIQSMGLMVSLAALGLVPFSWL